MYIDIANMIMKLSNENWFVTDMTEEYGEAHDSGWQIMSYTLEINDSVLNTIKTDQEKMISFIKDEEKIVKLKDFFEENLGKTIYITTDENDYEDLKILSCFVE